MSGIFCFLVRAPGLANVEKKRYQVFVSSTYDDLKEARGAVFDALTRIDCIPTGMEIFPAFDEEQLAYIKSIIDDSDYYILIIGGRYGSVTSDGISFTEKEYDYAVSLGRPVLSFIHSKPESIPVGKTDNDVDKRVRLDKFIEKARGGRLVKEWEDVKDLSLKVTQAVMHSIKAKPGIGWIRGSAAASVDILAEINELRKQNQALQEKENKNSANQPEIEDIASLDSSINIRFMASEGPYGQKSLVSLDFSWKKIFSLVGPAIVEQRYSNMIEAPIVNFIKQNKLFGRLDYASMLEEDRETIKWQLIGYKLIELVDREKPTLKLTDSGVRTLISIKVIRA